jgi:hypothetical protein
MLLNIGKQPINLNNQSAPFSDPFLTKHYCYLDMLLANILHLSKLFHYFFFFGGERLITSPRDSQNGMNQSGKIEMSFNG